MPSRHGQGRRRNEKAESPGLPRPGRRDGSRPRPAGRRVRRRAAQHTVHHGRRPRVPRHELLRQPHQQDAKPRPHRGRRHAAHELLLHQLHLRPKPRHHPHRQAQPRQRLPAQRPDLRRQPADLPQAPSAGWLPDRHDRQVAPAQPAHRLRLLERPPRPGRLPRPRPHRDGPAQEAHRLRHRHHHRPHHRLAPQARQDQALPGHVPPQGASPQLAARQPPRQSLRRRRHPRAANPRRRLQDPGHRRPHHDHDHRAPPDQRRRQGHPAQGAHRPGQEEVVLPAIHQGLPPLREGHRRERRAPARLPRQGGPRPGHHRGLHLRPGLLPRRPRLVRQAIHVRGIPPHALHRPLSEGHQGQRGQRRHRPQHRLRPHLPRLRRRPHPQGHARPERPRRPRRPGARRLAHRHVLPLLRVPRRPRRQAPLRGPHQPLQAHPLLPRRGRMGALRPQQGPPRAQQPHRRPRLRRHRQGAQGRARAAPQGARGARRRAHRA